MALSRRNSFLHTVLGTAKKYLLVVQQSGTSDFVVRTSVPVRMSGRLSRMIKQYESSGTSWYELVGAGTEVTNRREPRENRRTSRV
jgi:hypothetical protein